MVDTCILATPSLQLVRLVGLSYNSTESEGGVLEWIVRENPELSRE
jgi:hypothetical protein